MRFTRRLHRSDEGAAVAMALMVGAILVGFTTVVASAGIGQTRAVGFDENWELAFHAAEAAGELGLREVTASATFNTGHLKSALTTTAAIIAAADARPSQNLHPVPGAEFVVVKPSDDTVVYGVGYSPTRAAIGRRVRVIAIQYGGGTSSWSMPAAAIIGNTYGVELGGGSTTQSDPASAHNASVISNANVKLSSSSWVDGNLTTAETVDFPSKVYGTVTQGAPPFVFPTDAEVEAWRATLRTQAQSTGQILTGDIRFKNTTITAPMYVNGSLTLEETVTILGTGVIYATDNLKMPGGGVVSGNGITLVSDVLVEFSGGSEFQLTDPNSSGGLVSFGVNIRALKLSGGSAGSTQGIAYAPYGGIELSGGSTWRGGLIAGGVSNRGMVKLSGGSDVIYPSSMNTAGYFSGLGTISTTTVSFRSER